MVKEEAEDIQLGHSVIFDGKQEGNVPNVRVGSNQQWKFKDILQVDGKKKEQMEEWGDTTANTDDRPPFKIPLSERCEEKLKSKGISLPSFLISNKSDKEEKVVIEKENARIHYDKEDLISFH